MNNLPRVLIIDESESDQKLASMVLAGEFGNLDVQTAGTAAEFSAALTAGRFGLVVTESKFTWGSGADLVRLVRDVRPNCPVILFTAEVGEQLWSESLRLGVDAYVSKSSDGFVRLPAVVRSVLFRSRRTAMANTRDAPYRRLVESLPVGVFVANLEGEILEANQAFAAMLGLSNPEEVAWSTLPGFFVETSSADLWRTQMASTRQVRNMDVRLRRVGGDVMWARLSCWVVEDTTSGMRHIQGVVEETGDYHAAQEELSERSEALSRSNEELEQFAYVVSHDLQQPLSLVSSYLELLSDSIRDKLEGDEESFLDRAAAGAVKMQEMVDAVLGYARVDTRGGEFEPVNLDAVVEEVKTELWKEITCAKAEIFVDPLPTVLADPSQMALLFRNLLSNAMKFSDHGPAKVFIGVEEKDDEWLLSVRDEGIGIAPEAAERIFVMFQRLHTDTEIPGTGIGLAICKRIVERHGGRIWVESHPGEGATFFIAIPRYPAENGV